MALFITSNDRGHFMPFPGVARGIRERLGLECELWTHEDSTTWLGASSPFGKVVTNVPSVSMLSKCYKTVVTKGSDDPSGSSLVWSKECAGLIAEFQLQQDPQAAMEELMPQRYDNISAMLEERLKEGDVQLCVIESSFMRTWAEPVILKTKETSNTIMPKILVLSPSYLNIFRFHEPREFFSFGDVTPRLLNRIEDCAPPNHEDVSIVFVLAKCLADAAPLPSLENYPGKWARFGPSFGPTQDDRPSQKDMELMEWINNGSPVTLISLGSYSTLSTLSSWAAEELVVGCLKASPRVLYVGVLSEPTDKVLIQATTDGRLVCQSRIPQRVILSNSNVHCFVSHCGANSSHEALASATVVVPLPFFDDQYYIAQAFSRLYFGKIHGYMLDKNDFKEDRTLAAGKVTEALMKAFSVPQSRLKELQKETLDEDGANSIASYCAELIKK